MKFLLDAKEGLLIMPCLESGHFMLFIADITTRTFYAVDSLRVSKSTHVKKFESFLKERNKNRKIPEKWKYIFVEKRIMQANGSICGACVIFNVDYVIKTIILEEDGDLLTDPEEICNKVKQVVLKHCYSLSKFCITCSTFFESDSICLSCDCSLHTKCQLQLRNKTIICSKCANYFN